MTSVSNSWVLSDGLLDGRQRRSPDLRIHRSGDQGDGTGEQRASCYRIDEEVGDGGRKSWAAHVSHELLGTGPRQKSSGLTALFSDHSPFVKAGILAEARGDGRRHRVDDHGQQDVSDDRQYGTASSNGEDAAGLRLGLRCEFVQVACPAVDVPGLSSRGCRDVAAQEARFAAGGGCSHRPRRAEVSI